MIVVDASAILEALIGARPDPALVLRLGEEDLHAPHLIDVEVLHSLRVMASRQAASSERVEAARADFEELRLTRYPHTSLRPRIWAMRPTLSAYDACYVALAEALDVHLVTTDRRVAGAPGVQIDVDVYERAD